MSKEIVKQIKVNITESQTITELSKLIQKYDAELFLKKEVLGTVIDVNLKSFLGLITLQLKNGDNVEARAIGDDSDEAIHEVIQFLTNEKDG